MSDTKHVKLFFDGNSVRTMLAEAEYGRLIDATEAPQRRPWLTLRQTTETPLTLNLDRLIAIKVVKPLVSERRKPGVSVMDIYEELKDTAKAKADKLTYRKLHYKAKNLPKKTSETPGGLEWLSKRRLATTDHNFDLLDVSSPKARKQLRDLERQRQLEATDEQDDGENET